MAEERQATAMLTKLKGQEVLQMLRSFEGEIRCNVFHYNAVVPRVSAWSSSLHFFSQLPTHEVSPNVASYGAVLGALRQWQAAMLLLGSARGGDLQPDLICLNALRRSAPWQLAMEGEGNAISFNSMISACGRSGQWQAAGSLLARMRVRRLANGISLGAFVAACGTRGQWPRALEACQATGLKPSAVTFNAAISACEKAAAWPPSIALLRRHPAPDIVSQNAAMSVCEKASCWQTSLTLASQRDLVTYSAAICAVGRGRHWDQALLLLDHMAERLLRPNAVCLTAAPEWRRCMAQLDTEMDLDVDLKDFSCKELSATVWSWASSSQPWPVKPVLQRLDSLRGGCEMADLARLAWALAPAAPGALIGLQQEFISRLNESTDLLTSSLTMLWACTSAGCLRAQTAEKIKGALLTLSGSFPGAPLHLASIWPQVTSYRPQILREFADLLVLQKPSQWQVDDGEQVKSGEAQRGLLSPYLQAMFPHQPVLRDLDHSRGFLHRLDVPSSGLILVAKTHRAWYDLKMQAAKGEICRDYVALAHGWLDQGRQEIDAPVFWWPNARSLRSVVAPGRPAQTTTKLAGRYCRAHQAQSRVLLRIGTGRRHQIRLHMSHIGHPTVSDGKYSSLRSFKEDLKWSPRHFLHRSC